MRSKNSSLVVKLYSRPFCSPWRGERVVSVAKTSAKAGGEIRGRAVADERETEKPKVSGWLAKRRVSIVDFPDPEGPEMTMGRCFCVACHLS